MTMLRAGGLLDVLTPLSDCRQESVEKMERIVSGGSYMYWMDFHNGILCCGFLCFQLISVSLFPATTPHACLFSGYHAEGYHAPSIHHGLSRPGLTTTARLSRLCIYIPAITPQFSPIPGLSHPSYHAPPHTCIGLSHPPLLVVRSLRFHRLSRHVFFSIYTTTGAPHVPAYSTPRPLLLLLASTLLLRQVLLVYHYFCYTTTIYCYYTAVLLWPPPLLISLLIHLLIIQPPLLQPGSNRRYVCCTQEHDGDDAFYIREFHILMRHCVYQ